MSKKKFHSNAVSFLKQHASLLTLIAVSSILIWLLVEIFVVDADRYLPRIATEVEDAIGLPATIGHLDIVLFPKPHVTAYDIVVGNDDFFARADSVTAYIALSQLLSRNIDITSVTLSELSLTLPSKPGRLSDKINGVVDSIQAIESGGGGVVKLSAIREISTSGATLYLSGNEDPYMWLDIQANDVVSEHITATATGALPNFGEHVPINIEATVDRKVGTGITSIVGSVNATAIELARAIPIEGVPETTLNTLFEIKGSSISNIGVILSGTSESDAHPALAGRFSTVGWYNKGVVTLNTIQWTSPGVHLATKATRAPSGSLRCEVAQLELDHEALNSILGIANFDEFHLEAAEEASLQISGVLIELNPEWRPRFLGGTATFDELTAVLASGETVDEHIGGTIELKDGLIQVQELGGDGFAIAGSLLPDAEKHSIQFNLVGETSLTRARIVALSGLDNLREAQGTLHFKEISGTYIYGEGVPVDLVIEATLSDGRVRYAASDLELLLDPVIAEILTDAEGINTLVQAYSEDTGDMGIKGRYDFENYRWMGTAAFNVPHVISPLLASEAQRTTFASALEQYGDSRFQTKIQLPSSKHKGLEIFSQREGSPPLEATVTFKKQEKVGLQLARIAARTRLDVARLDENLISGIDASGDALITFERIPETARFETHIDLKDARARLSRHLEKKLGDTLNIHLSGDASPWVTEELTIQCLDAHVPISMKGDGFHVENISIPLTQVQGLLPKGSTANGDITLSMNTARSAYNLSFNRAGFFISDDLNITAINGTVDIADGLVNCPELQIRGAKSDCILSLYNNDGAWKGHITGTQLDVNAIQVFMDAADSFQSDPPSDDAHAQEANDQRSEPLLGVFDVSLAKLFYRRGRLDAVRAHIVADEQGIHVRNLNLRPYTGSVTGTVDIIYADTDYIDMNLGINKIASRALDEMAFEEARNFSGIVSGDLQFRAPLTESQEMMAGSNGHIVWTAYRGSFGKLGFATKLLTVLKTTEIVSFRMPSLRDKGLTYDVCTGTLDIKDGRMAVQNIVLDSPSHKMEANGIVDFKNDAMDVDIFVHVLESVTKLLNKVPGIRKVTGATTERVGMRVNVTGSPFDPQFDVGSGGDGAVSTTTDKSGETVKKVTGGVKGAIKGLLGNK